ncbi:MAG: Maf family protein [Rubricoccaceae bacterium]|nr:Maf family protein [Rubricoccaceae bacterium]
MLRLQVPLVLASRSPRRRALLERLGLTFDVRPASSDEVWPQDCAPGDAVERLAQEKAEEVARSAPEALTLGADTVVVLADEVLGKPSDADEARYMLGKLSGVTHTVYTGLALVHPATERSLTAHEATDVTFAPLSDREIERYVASGSPLDKAGAYGIQDDHGALFVAHIRGDYYNVVGLPLHRLYRLLRDHFPDLLDGGTPSS